MTVWDLFSVGLKTRTFYESFEWRFDQGFPDSEFTLAELEKNRLWRKFKEVSSIQKDLSVLPPPPQVRGEFWNWIGSRPEVVE